MPGDRAISLLTRLMGGVLLVVPLLPLWRIFGPTPGASGLVPPSEWLLGASVFGAAAWILALLLSGRANALYGSFGRSARRMWPAATLLGGAALMAGVLLAVGWIAFRHRPHHIDSIAQVFQARAFAAGGVTAPPFEPAAFFAVPHVVRDPTGWYGQYPPGHAALLAVGLRFGAEWIVPALLSTGTFLLLVLFARRVFGRDEAILTGLLLLACPFFWIMGASFMNHVSALFFVAAFLYAFARWESDGSTRWIGMAGAALGGAFLSRPWDAIAVGVPFAVAGGVISSRRRDGLSPLAGAAAFVIPASLYLVFNAVTTGDPWVPGYIVLWGESHGLGFHTTPWGEAHTPWTGLRNELIDLSLLQAFLFEWPIPALWPAGLFLLAGREVGRWERWLGAGLLALPAAYFFYWHRDAYLGPRFLYPSVAFIAPLSARALLVGARRWRGRRIGLPGVLRPADGGLWMIALMALCLLYSVFYSIPQRLGVTTASLPVMKTDLAAVARRQSIDRGVILVATSWGDRMLARLYGAGVSADLAEQVYRRVDHCMLSAVIDASTEWPAWRLEAVLRGLMRGPRAPRVGGGVNGDASLRLLPGRPLAPACRDEIEYDRRGFTVYPPHLLDNDWEGKLVVARDLRSLNRQLIALHPDLPVYHYRPHPPVSRCSPRQDVEMPTLEDGSHIAERGSLGFRHRRR